MKRAALNHPSILLAISAVATLLLYGRVLSLPLFMDDVVFLRITSASSLWQMFFAPLPLEAYYRPMSLLPSWIIQRLLGNSAPALHSLSLTLHLLNGWLLSLLARRLWPERMALPALTLLLWISFPFAYEAVHWHAAIQQAMATFGILLTLLFSARWWDSRHRLDLALALAGSFVAFFSHEVAIVTPGLAAIFIAAIEAAQPTGRTEWPAQARRLAGLLLPMIGVAALYLLGRGLAPRLGQSQGLITADLPIKALYFAQGLAYPLAWFGGALSRGGVSESFAAALSSGAGLIMLALAAIRFRGAGLRHALPLRDRINVPVLLGIAWFALAVSAPLLFLPASYVLSGPRLMLAASAGAALAWAGLIGGLWQRLRGWRRIAPAAMAALILAGSTWFIESRLALHRLIEPLYREVYTSASEPGRMVYINLPAWVAYRSKVYGLGSEGVIYQGDFFRFTDLVMTNSGQSADIAVYYWPGNAPELPGYYAPPITEQGPQFEQLAAHIRESDRAAALISLGDRFTWLHLDRGQAPGMSSFSNGVAATVSARIDGGLVRVQIGWQVERPATESVFVHLLCEGVLLAQADGPPLAGLYPFTFWEPGESRIETRLIPLPEGTRTGCQQIALGLYDPASGARVPLVGGGEALLIGVEE